MNNIKQAQIICNVDVKCQKQIVVFDSDNLVDTESLQTKQTSRQDISNRKIQQHEAGEQNTLQLEPIAEETVLDPKLVSRFQQQLKHTHDNLFKTVITNEDQNKKKPNIKSLQSIRSIATVKSNSVLKQGYIQKKTDGIIFKWKLRYFTLTPQKLYFFENNKKQKVIGCVNIKMIQMQVRQKNQELILDFMGECQNIIFKFDNKQERQQWRQWIEQVIKYQSSQMKVFLQTMKKPLYKQQDTILERQFLSKAETGDILLFYTNHTGAKIQRVLTNSDFDHVAMVVKFRKHQVMVFQSNQTTGVALFQWSQYVRCFNLYEKITYRKLVSPRKQEIQHNLLKFVKINLGRKFNLSLSKLFTFQSDFSWELLNEDVERGFFCSQLVAKAYKSIGLLDPVRSSCRYWPVDFSQKNDLKLLKGAYLGLQQSIVLNKHIKKIE